MVQKKTLLFIYDFPHSKSVDFIFQCVKKNIKIDAIVAASYKKINKPKSLFNFHKHNTTLEHPKDLAVQFNIPYFNYDHNSPETKSIIKELQINFGIIAGARMLKKNLITKFSYGVLNIHPGLLPYSRGLDSILWAVHNNKKLGVTAHLINEKVDLGKLVLQKTFKPIKSDTIFDIYNKIYKMQIDLLPLAYNLIPSKFDFQILNSDNYNTYMTEGNQKETLKKLKHYIANYSKN